MPSTTLNFITTTFLTLVCAATLLITYRRAIRPILSHYNIPLQSLPSFLTRRSRGWMDAQYRRINTNDQDDNDHAENGGDDEGDDEETRIRTRTSRDLEEGFRDDSDEEEVDVGGQRGEGNGNGNGKENLRASEDNFTRGGLTEVPPRSVEEEDRFPATRIR